MTGKKVSSIAQLLKLAEQKRAIIFNRSRRPIPAAVAQNWQAKLLQDWIRQGLIEIYIPDPPTEHSSPLCRTLTQKVNDAYCKPCRVWFVHRNDALAYESEPASHFPFSRFVDVVFDGPPGHEAGRFVEVENSEGASVSVGEWIDRGDGYWALRLEIADTTVPHHCKPPLGNPTREEAMAQLAEIKKIVTENLPSDSADHYNALRDIKLIFEPE